MTDGTPKTPFELFDCDVVIGRDQLADVEARPETARLALKDAGVGRGLVSSLRAATFDVASGNDEAIAAAHEFGWSACGTLDLRDMLGAERELTRLHERGIRAVRLSPERQGVGPLAPSVEFAAKKIAALGMTAFVEGGFRDYWRPFCGRGASVVFLDTHLFHLGDFIVLAREEYSFYTSTRLLVGPDSLDLVCSELGPERLLLGSRAPIHEARSAVLRLTHSRLDVEAMALVGGKNLQRILEGET